ncbi:MAG: hypothetical protein AAGD96_17865, partial [Chloroflexota bacterium]
MRKLFQPSFVSQSDSRGWTIFYTVVTVLVALSMFLAASGSGSGSYVSEEPFPVWLDFIGNVVAALTGVLVLIPRTRIVGAISAVINMFISMYVNYMIDGIEYFALLSPYNTVTIMLASILIGHYAADLFHLIGQSDSLEHGHLNV